jgi:hypothetical protein
MYALKIIAAWALSISIIVPAVALGEPTALDRSGATAGAYSRTINPWVGPNQNLQRDVYLAIEHAIRTLPSRADRWRTAYFIKYNRMPDGEMPTVNEGFVYHAACFLIGEIGLTDGQREQILNAIYPN